MVVKVVIEFYRIREADDAHAVIGRQPVDAADLDDAIEIARQLWLTLDMPQQPDAVAISDGEGNRLYAGSLVTTERSGGEVTAMNARGNETAIGQYALAIGVWENEGGAPASVRANHRYGRRVKADRSSTIYTVFTGVPAPTDGMLSHDHRKAGRGKEPIAAPSFSSKPAGAVYPS